MTECVVRRGEVHSVPALRVGRQQKRRKKDTQRHPLQQHQGPGGPEVPIFPSVHHPIRELTRGLCFLAHCQCARLFSATHFQPLITHFTAPLPKRLLCLCLIVGAQHGAELSVPFLSLSLF